MEELQNVVKCKIADFSVAFQSDIKRLDKILREYTCDFEKHDLFISISDSDIEFEHTSYKDGVERVFPTTFKITALFRKLGEMLPSHNAFVLHSACFDVEGTGVAFAAHSGTGKTTHMNLWQELLGDKMTVVNGDKPIIRFFDDEPNTPYAYGTPWNGKERLGCNMRTKLKHICFIERSKTNYVTTIEKSEAVSRLMKQVYMPKDPVALAETMQLIDRLLSCCSLWKIHCNMEIEAAEVAYNTIFNVK